MHCSPIGCSRLRRCNHDFPGPDGRRWSVHVPERIRVGWSELMATLVLKNTTAAIVTITDASAVIIPASGQDTYNDPPMIVQLAKSQVLQALVTAGTLVVNDGTSDLIVAVGLQYLGQLLTQSGFNTLPNTIMLFQMQLGNALDAVALPLTNCGIEIVQTTKTLTSFQARRGTPGTAGTTTIQLELNGVAVVGATLSWTTADAAFALKTVAITVAVVVGDRLSFRLTSAETGAEDILAEAN